MKLDLTKFSHQLLSTAMLEMVEKDGLTPREVFEVLEDAKSQLWSALSEVYGEMKSGKHSTGK